MLPTYPPNTTSKMNSPVTVRLAMKSPPARQYPSPPHSSPRSTPNSNINNMAEHKYHHQYHHQQQQQQQQDRYPLPPAPVPPPAPLPLPLPLSPQQRIRNITPSEQTDAEILHAYGYTDIWHLMTQHNLDPFSPADVDSAKATFARLRLEAQGKRDGMVWGGLVEAWKEGKRVGDEGREAYLRLREERWQSQNEWASWDREQIEIERSARMRRESLRGKRR